MLRPARITHCRPPEDRPANENRTSAERERFGNVSTSSDAAVEDDRQSVVHCADDIFENVDCTDRPSRGANLDPIGVG